jgi:hypothetical protein
MRRKIRWNTAHEEDDLIGSMALITDDVALTLDYFGWKIVSGDGRKWPMESRNGYVPEQLLA